MLRWVHPEKGRYYQADLVEDLLGGWSVVTAWGATGSRHGRVRSTWVRTREDAEKRLGEIEKRRMQRGYVSLGKALRTGDA
ncbi:MAG: WGR domain-containing protein [Gammaproteobacteria bacterium]|nr:WGR domain-containing protein [Gammaproteobacteria bacterium]